ncbi:SPOR domain-containing protein [Paragemmobacter straminiformis]|uniref:SPOR domain-containing protein n=1 Tax=Paragemmobacter straminiformis TaxID=2045119 RepID=A0A842I4Q1_9RHOB|nr:SPOR domain-containing protein [Gemmobacter straminiformis]MBC2834114.1 SPOR domain-containing protein [Gemmobacter straminiformis]
MFIKFVTVAALAAVLGAPFAQAQTVSQVGGPKELPPAGFTGMQYIDSRGCVFLRAGLGGNINWVPRVGSNRKVLCGYPPTFGGKGSVAVAQATPAPEPAPLRQPQRMAEAVPESSYVPPPARVGKPIPTAMPAPMVQAAAPLAAPRPASALMVTVAPGASVAASAGRVSCPASAPSLKRLPLTNGGTVLVCAPGDGQLRGLRSPTFAGGGVGAAFEGGPLGEGPLGEGSADAPVRAASAALGQPSAQGRAVRDLRVASATVAAPQGYTAAWKDDRLNPLRGVGTAQGQAMQDQVWTRKVPAKLVGDTPRARRMAARAAMTGGYEGGGDQGGGLSLSSKSAPVAVAGRFVQVGSFGVPANAAGAVARLASAGLPVAQGRSRGMTVVMAGPFASGGDLAAALQIARASGFGDAFVR